MNSIVSAKFGVLPNVNFSLSQRKKGQKIHHHHLHHHEMDEDIIKLGYLDEVL
jgi:hypothetical protein